MKSYDAVVVGSGPNGLAAAITLARANQSVLLIEAKSTVGGGMRSLPLTQDGFIHDVCSAVHPFGEVSPFFKTLPLKDFGLSWIHSEATIAHPLDEGKNAAILAYKSLEQTAEGLGRDKAAYDFLMQPIVDNWEKLAKDVLHPLLSIPKHPLALARFGWRSLPPATLLANAFFRTPEAKALFAGVAAHSILPLGQLGTSAAGVLLGSVGHVGGWPFPKGGAQTLANALTGYFESLGGKIQTDWQVKNIDELPKADAVFLDVTPKQFLAMTEHKESEILRGTKNRLEHTLYKRYRYGAAAFKIDYALSEAVPWNDPKCAKAATVHLGGTLEELTVSERGLNRNKAPDKPYTLIAQPSLFDDSRAPSDKHTLWAYCHVPNGYDGNMSDIIENQIERFAKGFKECIIAKHVTSPSSLESYNANYIGGDINGGAATLWQLVSRPVLSTNPYKTPLKDVYLCSSSTPPGGGVHGMCGYNAAQSYLALI